MKKAKPENILKEHSRSFLFSRDRIFYADEIGYHVHQEMELMAITDCGGKCLVNELEYDFEGFDVVFVPGGIPHCWIMDPLYCRNDGIIDDCCCKFQSAFLKQICNVVLELRQMADFFLGLRQAIRITGDSAQNVISAYHKFTNYSEGKQATILIGLLNDIYENGEYHLLGLPSSKDGHISKPRMRFQIINKFIMENYGRKITLSEASGVVNMSPTAFCNAFKASTGKSFNNYLTAYRLQIAGRLLTTTLLNISEIAYKIGFGDFSHFTRTFTRHYGMSPTEYRKRQKAHPQ